MSFPFGPAYVGYVTGGAQMVTIIQVLDATGHIIADSSDKLLVTNGTVTCQSNGNSRRQLNNLIVLDPTGAFIPDSGFSLLSPTSSHELQVFCGYNDTIFPAGRYRITGADINDVPEGVTITITGEDRAVVIADNVFDRPYVVQSGQYVEDAVIGILNDRLPSNLLGPIWVTYSGQIVTQRFVIQRGTDPWQAIQDLCTAYGIECFFRAEGTPRIRPVPDPMNPTDPVVWNYTDAATTSTLVKVTRSQSSTDSPNAVRVSGQGSQFPPTALALDDNPNSATYYYGTYGKRLKDVTDARVFTDTQALTAARALLRKSIGTAETVKLSVIPNPCLEPGDVIRVGRPSSHLDHTLYIDNFNLPLQVVGAPTMDIECRVRRI